MERSLWCWAKSPTPCPLGGTNTFVTSGQLLAGRGHKHGLKKTVLAQSEHELSRGRRSLGGRKKRKKEWRGGEKKQEKGGRRVGEKA